MSPFIFLTYLYTHFLTAKKIPVRTVLFSYRVRHKVGMQKIYLEFTKVYS